jgi:beta-hydroxylase
MKLIYLIILIIINIIIILIYNYNNNNNNLLDKNFYTIDETFPYLNKIYNKLDIYKTEFSNLQNNLWFDWIETDLYKNNTKDADWKIIPFYGFNTWVKKSCNKCPEFYKFLKSIPNLKIAILSKMGPNTILSEHQGWGTHSNFVLRCHFGLDIPNNCYVSVGYYDKNKVKTDENIIREVKKYERNKWIIFDDSKFHYTYNHSNKDRTVLILDIERPSNIKKGVSTIGNTKELDDLLKYFKNI